MVCDSREGDEKTRSICWEEKTSDNKSYNKTDG